MARQMGTGKASHLLEFIIAISLGLIFITAFMAPQVTAFFDTDTTGWDDGSVALWGVVIIAVLAGIVIVILKNAGIL